MATITIMFGERARRIARPASYRDLISQARITFPMMGSVNSLVVLLAAPAMTTANTSAARIRFIELDPTAYHTIQDGEAVFFNVQEPITKEYILPLPDEDPDVARKPQTHPNEVDAMNTLPEHGQNVQVSPEPYASSCAYQRSSAFSPIIQSAGGDAFGNGWGAASAQFRQSATLIPNLEECKDAIGLSVGESNEYPDELVASDWKAASPCRPSHKDIWATSQRNTENDDSTDQAQSARSSRRRIVTYLRVQEQGESPRAFKMYPSSTSSGGDWRLGAPGVESVANHQRRCPGGSTTSFPEYDDLLDTSTEPSDKDAINDEAFFGRDKSITGQGGSGQSIYMGAPQGHCWTGQTSAGPAQPSAVFAPSSVPHLITPHGVSSWPGQPPQIPPFYNGQSYVRYGRQPAQAYLASNQTQWVHGHGLVPGQNPNHSSATHLALQLDPSEVMTSSPMLPQRRARGQDASEWPTKEWSWKANG